MQHLSPTAQSIIASLRASLAALDDHQSQTERDLIYQQIAAHLRSASPLALTGTADLVEPLPEARMQLSDGACVELKPGLFYALDATGKDVALALTLAQQTELASMLTRVR